jgi:YVTN family beta-propeller protein
MNLRISGLLAIAAFALTDFLGSAQSLAQNAYITNQNSGNVSVIDTVTNTVIATIPIGNSPDGVAVTSDGSRAYVTNTGQVSAIDTATNTVIATVFVGDGPFGVAVTPDGSRLYITSEGSGTVSVIATASNTVI